MLKIVYRFGQGLVFASLFLPLVIKDDYIFPFITPRNFLFRLFMSFGLGVIVLLWLNLKELRPKKNWLNIAILAVIGAKFLSGIFGVNFYNSFWSSYERMEGIIGWLFLGIFYFLVITVFRKKQEWRWLFRIALIPALAVAIYGIGQAWGWSWVMKARQSRIEAQLGNAAYVGAYMVIHIGIAFYLIFKDKNIWWRVLAGFALLPFHLALFYSATRGAGLGWLLGFFVAVIFYIIFGKNKKARLTLAIAAVATLLLVVGIWSAQKSEFVQKNEFLRRMTSIHLQDGTVKSRLKIWQMAWHGFLDRPIFGWGQDNFNYVFNKYFNSKIGEQWVDRAHNNLLDQLSMNGILGFLAYLAVILFPFYVFFKYRKKEPLVISILLGLWTAYVVQNQFVFDSLNTYIYFFILLGFVLFKYEHEYKDEPSQSSMMAQYSQSYNRWLAGLLIILAVVVNLIFSWPGAKANRMAIASLLERSRNPELALEKLEKATAINSFGNKEIALQTNVLIYDWLSSKAIPDDLKTRAVLFSIKSLKLAAKREPEDVRVLMMLSSMYRIARVLDPGYLKKAEKVTEKVIELSPGRVSAYYDLAQVKSLLGDKKAALAALEKAYKLDPDNRKSIVNLVSLLNEMGDPSALQYADELYDKYLDRLNEQDLSLLAAVYFRWERLERAEELFKKLTEKYPDNISYWQKLGQIYQMLGKTSQLPKIDQELKRLDAAPLASSTQDSR